jgi:flagellar protein FliO/FliZ
VGSAQNAVNLVSEIDDKESVDEIRLAASQEPKQASGGFARMFKDRFGTGPLPPAGSETASNEAAEEDPASYLKRQKERLKDL